MKKLTAFTVITMVLVLLPTALHPVREIYRTKAHSPDKKIEIDLEIALHSINSCYMPIRFTFRNRAAPRDVKVTIDSGNTKRGRAYYADKVTTLTTRRLQLPTGETTIEIPVLRDFRLERYMVTVEGIDGGQEIIMEQRVNPHHSYRFPLVLFTGNLEKELEDSLMLRNDSKKKKRRSPVDPIRVLELQPREFPAGWQGLLGYSGVVIIDSREVFHLPPNQKQALRLWLCYGGGTVWIYGENPAAAVKNLELPLTGRHKIRGSSKNNRGIQSYHCITGLLLLTEKEQLSPGFVTPGFIRHIIRTQESMQQPFNAGKLLRYNRYSYQYSRYGNSSGHFRHLLRDLHSIPRTGYILALLLLIVIIGPLNYFYLKSRKKTVYFYVTTPLLAVAGIIALGAYSLLNQGLGVKYNRDALLLHQLNKNDGVLYHARGIFAGLGMSEPLKHSRETAVLPFFSQLDLEIERHFKVDCSTSLEMEGGWVPARRQCGIFTATPVRVRMGLDIKRRPGGSAVLKNNLTHDVVQAYVRLPANETGTTEGKPKEQWYMVHHVPAGGQGTLIPIKMPKNIPYGKRFFNVYELPWKILAETSGLPYIPQDGLTGEVMRQRFFYLGVEEMTTAGGVSGAKEDHIQKSAG